MQYIPYTTCKLIPQDHLRVTDLRKTWSVPEVKSYRINWTTCQTIPQQHVRQ